MTDYSYMQDQPIDSLLNCPFCSKPFIDPVINADGKRSCRVCATSTDVAPDEGKLLLGMLDSLRVECNKCHEQNIRRGNYKQHSQTICPQRTVKCTAADLKCPWTGVYEKLNQHLQSCPFEVLRPIFTELFAQIGQTRIREEVQIQRTPNEEWEQQSMQYRNELEHLREQRTELENAIGQLTTHLGSIPPRQETDPTNQIAQLTTLYNEQVNRANQLEAEIQRLRKLFLQQMSLLTELQKKVEQYKQSIDQNTDIRQLKEQFESQIKQLAEQGSTHSVPSEDQNVNDDVVHIKQLIEQHGVQIKLLARKKCVIAGINLQSDPTLETSIDQFMNNSEINLDGKQLIDHNMDVICKKAISEKRCSKLRLLNNRITGKGASILANALYNNTTLVDLYLSRNQISDIGVHALAQTLSVNNCTLKVLDLYSNNITDEGIEYLAEMLKINRTIIRLGLGSNQITNHGVRLLTNTITSSNKTLQWLSLSSNRLINDESRSALNEMLTCNSALKTLWLNDCGLSQEAIGRLQQTVIKNENFILEI